MKKLTVLFKYSLLLVFCTLFFSQCVSAGGSKSGGNKKYEEFFIEGGHMQYYVSSQEYVNKNGKETLKLDYTMRDSITNSSFINVNFTLKSSYGIKQMSQCDFVFSGEKNSIVNIERVYIEKVKNNYLARYSGKLVYEDWTKTQQLAHVIHVVIDEKTFVLEPTKKAIKSMKTINNSVVDIMNLSIEKTQ